MKEIRTVDKESRLDLLNSDDFYFYYHGIVYQNALDLPDSDYYPIKPKGRKIPGQDVGCLRIPAYGGF
jgi:hypothetical protein